MLKRLFIIIFILGLIFLLWLLFNYYKNSQNFLGSLRLKVYPPNSLVKINDKIYTPLNGNLNIQLKSGEYLLNVFLNGYLNYEQNIKIEPKQKLVLEDVYLLPLDWRKINLVPASNIKSISLSENKNRLFYIAENKDKNSKISYSWFIYDRETKENEEVFTSKTFPLNLDFISRKIMTELKQNDWQIILPTKSLLRDLNIVTQSLNNLFEKEIKKLDLKVSKIIKQAIFVKNNENKIILKTEDAIFLFDLLEEQLNLIYQGKSSAFVITEKNIYFIDQSGLLTKADIFSSSTTPLSLFSFGEENLEKIKIKKHPTRDEFLIITGDSKLYYFNKETADLPIIIKENIKDADFSLIPQTIVFTNNTNDKWIIYNLINQEEKEIDSKIAPVNFLRKDYWLVIKDNSLGIDELKTGNFHLIAEDIANNNFFFDEVLKKIYFATKEGIIEVSY